MQGLFGVLFLGSTAVQLYASWTQNRKLKNGSKGFVLAALLGFYVAAAPAARPAMIMALVFSLLGDMLLLKSDWLVFGGFAFFFAHCSYILAYHPQTDFARVPLWQILLIAAAYAVALMLMVRVVTQKVTGKLKLAATGYLLGICVMSFFALMQLLSIARGDGGRNGAVLVFAGTLSFILSDFILLMRNFRADLKIWRPLFSVMVTYIAAQALIVLGMLRIGA